MARLEDGAEPHEVYSTILVLDFGYVDLGSLFSPLARDL